jgi:hypothetical protein
VTTPSIIRLLGVLGVLEEGTLLRQELAGKQPAKSRGETGGIDDDRRASDRGMRGRVVGLLGHLGIERAHIAAGG